MPYRYDMSQFGGGNLRFPLQTVDRVNLKAEAN